MVVPNVATRKVAKTAEKRIQYESPQSSAALIPRRRTPPAQLQSTPKTTQMMERINKKECNGHPNLCR
jgi:hypothetical protein